MSRNLSENSKFSLLYIAYLSIPVSAFAQITPDDTLGAERSSLVRTTLRGQTVEQIRGGARRGNHLFHSFETFHIDSGQQVYFANPSEVTNIFSRVTGREASVIQGVLGVDGPANLVLLNPNGILFGPTAQLDIQGAFTATTASAIQFGDHGFFSAINPDSPSLLAIHPSAYLFNQSNTADIVVQSNQVSNSQFPHLTQPGLWVKDGQALSLLGGNIQVDGGRLNTFGGTVNLGAVAGVGSVTISPEHRFHFPLDLKKGDIGFTNQAMIDVRALGGGNIVINAQNLTLDNGSYLLAGIAGNLGVAARPAGNISLNIDDTLTLRGSSLIINQVDAGGVGLGGDLEINANVLRLTGGSQLQSLIRGEGQAGDITLNIQQDVSLAGSDANGFPSGIFTSVEPEAIGNGGQLTLTTDSLSLKDRAEISGEVAAGGKGKGGDIFIHANNASILTGGRLTTSVRGQGNGGLLQVRVQDTFSLDGVDSEDSFSAVFSVVEGRGSGRAGDVSIQAGSLLLSKGARLSTSNLTTNRNGTSQGGTLRVEVRDTFSLDGMGPTLPTGAFSVLDRVGYPGRIEIQANNLLLTNGAAISTSTFGEGNAGNLDIHVDNNFVIDGIGLNQQPSEVSSAVSRENMAGSLALGNGGQIRLQAGSLSIRDGARLTTNTRGLGNAGSIRITARDVRVVNFGEVSAQTFTALAGGNISIDAGNLAVRRGGRITTTASASGDAGNIILDVSDQISLSGITSKRDQHVSENGIDFANNYTGIFANTETNSLGNGGTITIKNPDNLSIRDNARISAATSGAGLPGNIFIRDTGLIEINNASISTAITREADPNIFDSRYGTINLDTQSLMLSNHANILASTNGQGNAGDITVRNADTISIDRSSISSAVGAESTGRGGNIELNTNSLDLNQGRISARTQAQGRGGTITVNADDAIESVDGNIETRSANSSSGNVSLSADSLRLRGDSDIRTQVEQGEGIGGSITLSADSIVAYHDSDIVTRATEGQGGDITIDSPAFFAEGYIPDTKEVQDVNDRVDIDASGVQSGIVTTPDVSFIQNSLSDLPDSAIDSDQLLANSCIARTESGSTFLITGSGGLPEQPGNSAASTYFTGEVRSIPVESSTESWQPGDAIVEPQSVYRLPDGRLVMSRECESQIN